MYQCRSYRKVIVLMQISTLVRDLLTEKFPRLKIVWSVSLDPVARGCTIAVHRTAAGGLTGNGLQNLRGYDLGSLAP